MSTIANNKSMHSLLVELYPICRSITGDGVRETLARLKDIIPLELIEVPSGTEVFDWTVPPEWNVQEAWIKDPTGRKIVDFADHNLHLVNYSVPVQGTFSLQELQRHLHSLPDQPEAIPYRTTYYRDDWGFCMRHVDRTQLSDGDYQVSIRATKQSGHLSYGELYIPGDSSEEILFSTHICHPSLANDNLSGIVVATEMARRLLAQKKLENGAPSLSVRFLFLPGTIGAISWLALNQGTLSRIRYGLVLSGLGDPGDFTYKKSRQGDCRTDRIVSRLLQQQGNGNRVVDFSPYGYDERQYCSPGIDLPIGSLSRTPYAQYQEYHTSNDNPAFVSQKQLEQAANLLEQFVQWVEEEQVSNEGLYWNANPQCEPQLGRRGLYGAEDSINPMAFLWILNFSDGNSSLSEIAERSGIPLNELVAASKSLLKEGLLRRKP